MALDTFMREMIGDPMANAVDAARASLGHEDVMARCAEGLWRVEVEGDVVADGLSHDEATAYLEGL